MALDKIHLRRSLLERREAMSAEERARRSQAVSSRVIRELSQLTRLREDPAASVFLFMPFGHEVDIGPVADWCWQAGIPLVASKTIREPRHLRLHAITSPAMLAPGTWGIREPVDSAPLADPAAIAAVLVPGVGFDPRGGRLGYGGGYYDRFFASLEAEAKNRPGLASVLKLAPAFDLQLVEEVPTEPHDVRMDLIITETRRLAISSAPQDGGPDRA